MRTQLFATLDELREAEVEVGKAERRLAAYDPVAGEVAEEDEASEAGSAADVDSAVSDDGSAALSLPRVRSRSRLRAGRPAASSWGARE